MWCSLDPELGDLEEQSGHNLNAVFKHCEGREAKKLEHARNVSHRGEVRMAMEESEKGTWRVWYIREKGGLAYVGIAQ